MLAGQLSVGWSNDACDAARDIAAGRTDKPVARRRDQRCAPCGSRRVSRSLAALAMAAAISPLTAGSLPCSSAPAGPTTSASSRRPGPGSCTCSGSPRCPRTRRARCPGSPAPSFWVCVAAGLVGARRPLRERAARPGRRPAAPVCTACRSGVAARWGPGAARAAALVLLLVGLGAAVVGRPGAAVDRGRRVVLLLRAGGSWRRWERDGCRSGRRSAIAAVDVAVFAVGGEALTSAVHLSGALR